MNKEWELSLDLKLAVNKVDKWSNILQLRVQMTLLTNKEDLTLSFNYYDYDFFDKQ